MTSPTRLIGVYHADGGLVGELRYAWNRLARSEHCELCDLTHAGLRRRAEWDAMVGRLGVPFTLVHLNERSEEVRRASAGQTPCVLAEVDGQPVLVLSASALAPVGRDVAVFERALRAALRDLGLGLPAAA